MQHPHIKDIPGISKVGYFSDPYFCVLNEPNIQHIRKLAATIKQKSKKSGNPLSQSKILNMMAIAFGFESWKHLINVSEYEAKNSFGAGIKKSDSIVRDFITEKQMMGTICRFAGINPKKVKSDVQIAIPDFYLNQEAPIHPLGLSKYGFISDFRLQKYFDDHKDIRFEFGFEVKYKEILFLRIVNYNLNSYEAILDFMMDVSFEINPLLNVGGPYYIWRNGVTENNNSPFSELPKEICKEIYV